MTTSLKLVWKYIDSTDIDTLDLLNSTDGFNLNRGGWSPQSVGEGDSSVIDVLNVRASGSSSNALATVLQDLDQYKKHLKWTRESTEARGIYLRTQFSGESNAREAYVYNLDYQINNPIYDIYPTRASTFQDISLTVEHGLWESPSVTSSASTLTITGNIGGSVLWGDTVYGDVPARLAELTFTTDVATYNTKAWFGFKTSRYGTTASNFVPYWPAASGYSGGYSADTSASNDGYGRSTVSCDFSACTTLVPRLKLRPLDFISSASDQRGEYLVLMAAMTDSGTTARARIGYADSVGATSIAPTLRSRVVVNGLTWTTYEMGNVTLPANYLRATDDLSRWSLRLDVEQLSGTGKFYCYGFFFIPLEGMIAISDTYEAEPTTIFTSPDGKIIAHGYNTVSPIRECVTQDVNWSVPANDEKPYLIGAVNKGYGDSANSTISVTYKYVKRWRTLRGSE